MIAPQNEAAFELAEARAEGITEGEARMKVRVVVWLRQVAKTGADSKSGRDTLLGAANLLEQGGACDE